MDTATELVGKENGQLQSTTPDQLLALAIDKNLDIEKLEKLMGLQERWEASKARKSFFSALTDFQNEMPEIRKTKKVFYQPREGRPVEYLYAPLSDIDRQIKKLMKEYGLSKRWEIKDELENITVTCLITHRDGHTEKTTMCAKADTTGSKNAIQAKGSSIEYMKRYTLIGALGISTADSDVDGQTPEATIDELHKDYMELYNRLIQLDSSKTKWHPDNWKSEPTAKVYVKAIGEIRKVLGQTISNQ